MKKLKLYVFFFHEQYSRFAPLFIDVFPYRTGKCADYYVSRNVRRARVRIALCGSVTVEQIAFIEHGRFIGVIDFYMVVPQNYKLARYL